MMVDGKNIAVEANKNQFLSTFHMLKKMVEICPEMIWERRFYEVPFWYQVYHCVYFLDYWFRDDYRIPFTPLSDIGKDVLPEFEEDVPKQAYISRIQMKEYISVLEPKVNKFFGRLTDVNLGETIMMEEGHYVTYTDIIVCQSRHIMYNMGYLNGILRSFGLEESDWWAYNEREQ